MAIGKLVNQIDPTVRNVTDGVAATISVGGFFLMDHVNILVLVLTALWTIIRIWETDTIKKLTGRFEEDKDG